MTRKKGFYLFATLVYLVAWFLPVIKGGSTLNDGKLPGVEALLVALGPLIELSFGESFVRSTLSVLSGASNAVFLVALVFLARKPPHRVRVMSRMLWAAALLNTYWQFETGLDVELRIGYYMWLASFVLLAVHATALARVVASEAASIAPPAPAA